MARLTHRRNRSAMQNEPHYAVGSQVQLYSEAKGCWTDAVVRDILPCGDVEISYWLNSMDQARLLRSGSGCAIDAIDFSHLVECSPREAQLSRKLSDAAVEGAALHVLLQEELVRGDAYLQQTADIEAKLQDAMNTVQEQEAALKILSEQRMAQLESESGAVSFGTEDLAKQLEEVQGDYELLQNEHAKLQEDLQGTRSKLESKVDVEVRLKRTEEELARLSKAFSRAAQLYPNVSVFRGDIAR